MFLNEFIAMGALGVWVGWLVGWVSPAAEFWEFEGAVLATLSVM